MNTLKFVAAGLVLGALIGCSGDAKKAETTDATKPETSAPAGDDVAKGRPEPTAETVKVEGDTIKLGIVASVSGDNKVWGDESFEGAKLAIEEANKAGGIQGKKIELEMQDSASTTQGAKTAAEKLLSNGVIGILGEVSSGNTIQIANSAFAKSVPVVAIGATKIELTDIGANVFRVCYSDGFQGPVMAKFAYDDLGLRNVALMTDNKLPYSQRPRATVNNFISRAHPGGVNARSFQEIYASSVYPGIDERHYIQDGHPRYDLIVQPNGRVSDIAMRFDGAKGVSVDSKGDLLL